MLAIDTNVLVHAHRRETAEHGAAEDLVRSLAEGDVPWAIPWPCVYEFFSCVTNRRIWAHTASSPGEAWEQLSAWLLSPSVRTLSETEEFPRILGRFLSHPRVRGPVVHDARIAALCVAHGVAELLTRDRDFALFPALKTRDPFRA